ncbi:hypothetical protein FACS1894218_7320 [Bacilli bacterium]|nr:hypothetical protein FACS1894218_7320 [Bacilli bacterium]
MVVPENADVNHAVSNIKGHINEVDSKSGFAIASYIEADYRVPDSAYPGYGRDDNNKPTLTPGEPLNPFDKFTKNDYIYSGQNKKYKEGTYIRQDATAKEYRGIAEELKKLYPSVDLSSGNTIQGTKSIAIQ